MLSAATSAAAAHWVVEGVTDFDHTVGSVVPAVFDGYARVFHPAWRDSASTAVEVRWSDVAARNRRVMHAAAEWGSLTGSWQVGAQPGMWDQAPRVGELPEVLAKRLAAILEKHTTGARRCCFAVAHGSGAPTVTFFVHDGTPDDLRRRERQATETEIAAWSALIESGASLSVPERPMRLLEGPLAAIGDFYEWYRSPPSLWWPDDGAWCVGTDIDLMTTYVGGSKALIDALLADDELESLAVSVDQRVDWEADTINPLPAPP